MKKFGMIVLAAALAFAMVGTAVAADVGGGFSAGASVYTKGRMDQFDLTGDADAAMYLINRGRFSFGYAADDYQAVLQLEIGDKTWGDTDLSPADNTEDQTIVEVKHLYITGPLGPVGLTVGLQALKLGNSIVYNDDDFAIKAVYSIPTGGALVIGYVKEEENATTSDPADDVTGLVVIYSNEVSGWQIDPFLAYGMLDEGAGDGSVMWFGVPVAGVAGPVKLNAELDYSTGSAFDIDIGGFAIWAKGTYPLAQANAFLELGYASGYDVDTGDMGFVDFANDFGYDIVFEDAAVAALGLTDMLTGINNKLFVKVGGEYMQSEQLTLGGAFIFSQMTPDVDEKALGNELDVWLSYKVSASATLALKYGYFMPGKALEGIGDEPLSRGEWSLTYNF